MSVCVEDGVGVVRITVCNAWYSLAEKMHPYGLFIDFESPKGTRRDKG